MSSAFVAPYPYTFAQQWMGSPEQSMANSARSGLKAVPRFL